jgi:hypothetical protein
MFPDLDSDSGIPVRETMSLVSLLVPMLLIQRLAEFEMSSEQLVLIGAGAYCLMRFGVGSLFRRFTVHRGMWHSLPAAAIAGFIALLLCSCEFQVRLFKAWGVVLGFLSHLVLDELYAVDINGHRIKIKKSFGSALKFFGSKPIPNLLTYGVLLIVIALIWFDPAFQGMLRSRGVEVPEIAQQTGDVELPFLKLFRR